MFKPAVADIEKNDRVEVWRIASKKGHNGHNTNRFQVKIAGQLLPITAVIKRAMRRPRDRAGHSRRSLHQTLQPFSSGSHEEFSGPLLEAGSEIELAERSLRLATSMTADRLILNNIDPEWAAERRLRETRRAVPRLRKIVSRDVV